MQASGTFMARRAWAIGEEKENDRPVMTSTSKAAPSQPKDQCDILQHSGGDPLTSLQELHLSLTQGTSPKVTEDFDLLKISNIAWTVSTLSYPQRTAALSILS